MAKKLFIDLEVCRTCPDCVVECSYFYHPGNDGIRYLRETAEFAVTCRHCDEAPCVASCPSEALEKDENEIVKRHNMRCVSCNTCAYACPFGTILPELVPYFTSHCDFCMGRLGQEENPLCVQTCPEKAVQYKEVRADEKKFLFEVSGNLVVHSRPWKKEDYI